MADDSSSVRVAVRIRPQLAKEIIDACKTCVSKTPEEPQVWIGSNKAFTYDYVYDVESEQVEVYSETVSDLIEGCFEGYNATVLAYGQTGSGKTYTMGTGFEVSVSNEEVVGIVPRAVRQLFEGIAKRQEEAKEAGLTPPEFKVSAQFLELYNEDILDLFDNASCSVSKSSNGPIGGLGKRSTSAGNSGIRIHEDSNGNIYTVGVTTRTVHSEEETMQSLKQGAFNRTTASTNMNDQSSRSHAIFTLYIQQQRQAKAETNPFHLELEESEEKSNKNPGDIETLTAKFHFVDLAGSERLKRTGATGDRAKEGISINCGLLALGNVISALGDTSRRVSHVPYRDSKLTRLLQDSLGGNSRTLMIACVSPSDRDFMETLNTLKYANRARNIKNKVTANQDKTSRTIMLLRQEIANLQFELMEYKQGKRIIGADGQETTNDMYHENTMLSKENSNLRTRIKAMQETIEVLTAKNSQLLADKELGGWITDNSDNDITAMVQKYITEIEELRAKLLESENLCEQLRKDSARMKRLSQINCSPLPQTSSKPSFSNSPLKNNWTMDDDSGVSSSVQELIQMAKKDLEKNKEERKRKSSKKDATKDEDKDEDSADDEESDENSDYSTSEDEEEDEEDEELNEKENINEELVELTSEISLKQKLIEELETSQKRLHIMKQQYETKLLALEQRIVATQEERDKVLKNINDGKGGESPEKINRVKQEYQEKLSKLQGEVKKLKTAQKEHAKLLRNQAQYERQVEKLKSEVLEMKRNKVRLVQKMKEESVRHREAENQRNREMSTLKKQTRKNESRIKSLEAEKRMKELALKRKNEEVSLLRRAQRRQSQLHQRSNKSGKSSKLNAKSAKTKWQNIETKITRVALQKQAVSQMENDMDRWLKEREKLSHKLERMRLKRRRLHAEKGQASKKLVEDLDDQIENLTSNVNYLQENIMECQQNIMQMEQTAELDHEEDENEEEMLSKMVNMSEIELPEAKYLLEKLLSMAVSQSCLAMQKDGAIREMENRMNQAAKQNTLHQQLLQHMIEQQDLEIYDLMLANEQGDEDSDSDSIEEFSTSSNTIIEINEAANLTEPGSDSSFGRREKARRKMTTKEDLLFNDTDIGPELSLPPVLPSAKNFVRSQSFVKSSGQDLMVRSRSFVKPSSLNNNFRNSLRRYQHHNNNQDDIMSQSADHSIISRLAPVYQPSPIMSRRNLDKRSTSPRSTLRKFNSAAKLNDDSVTPPGSPPAFRRSGSRDETGKNVFHRLVAGTTIGETDLPSKGVIHPYQGRIAPKSPLICSNVAEGHTKAVLSVFATDELLFSASKDRTVKVWDLCRKEEVDSLGGHPNNVVCVKYSQATRMAFTVSSAFIKCWDLRMSNTTCIKTLSSSGLTTNGPVQLVSANRTLAMPTGETAVTDIALSPSGLSLFSAAADKVRVWDLRKFHSIGKLSGGHQAAVMCLATGGDYVITGSKDHTIKVFNVTDGKGGVVAPTANLEPPHYDGIESLALQNDVLFSASRDTCIKKWNLRNNEVVRSLNNAHKDWICGLCFLPGGHTVISGCRAGYIKLWSVETCNLMGEMKAHNSTINTITTNNSHVFTGSNDGSIGIWRVRNNFDKSPDSEMSSSS